MAPQVFEVPEEVINRESLLASRTAHRLQRGPPLWQPRWLAGSLALWLAGSLARWLAGSLARCISLCLCLCVSLSLSLSHSLSDHFCPPPPQGRRSRSRVCCSWGSTARSQRRSPRRHNRFSRKGVTQTLSQAQFFTTMAPCMHSALSLSRSLALSLSRSLAL